jgi:hypothetical protein
MFLFGKFEYASVRHVSRKGHTFEHHGPTGLDPLVLVTSLLVLFAPN